MQLLYLEYLAYFIIVGIICLVMGWKLRGALFVSGVHVAQDENEKIIRALKNSENKINTIKNQLDNERANHRAEQQKLMQRVERLKDYKDPLKSTRPSGTSSEVDAVLAECDQLRSELSWEIRQKESIIVRFQEQLGQLEALRIENQEMNHQPTEDTALLKARIKELEAHVYHLIP